MTQHVGYTVLHPLSLLDGVAYIVQPGPALSRYNRCGCIGPRTSGGPVPLGTPRHVFG